MSGHGRTALALSLFTVAIARAPLVGQGQPAPSFKAGVDAVGLDLRVVDEKGVFGRGVLKDELRVVEDGVAQTITTFSMVELAAAAATAALPWPADVATNASFVNGRVYLVVLDDLHIHELRAVTVRQLARRFVEHYTTPADRVAIATTSGIGLSSQHFTNNRTDLLAAIDHPSGRHSASTWARRSISNGWSRVRIGSRSKRRRRENGRSRPGENCRSPSAPVNRQRAGTVVGHWTRRTRYA
ncbi:MAG TPA: hypothetical protein VFP85_14200 [Vicinamibacterales bacterium]|nr:hypothetical protein [Vicinamibacterales bacterium]